MSLNLVLLIAVSLVGGVGAAVRHWLAGLHGWLPWGTLLANTLASVVGASALVFFADPSQRIFELTIVVGFAGGLSTLSTLAGQTHGMLRDRQWFKALVYVLASFVIPSTGVMLVAMFR